MAIITPLTLRSTRSMMQMQRLQPELKRLQEKYKGDREKLNTEMMAFYKENQINPLSSCVPMLAQTPVFLILYRVLRGITQRDGGAGGGAGHGIGQQITNSSFTPWRITDQPFNPQHLSTSTEMYKSLSHTTKMNFLGVDLSLSPSDALKLGVVTAIPFLILMLLLLVSQIFQNRQIQGRTAANAPTNSQQQMLMKIVPFMLPIFSFGFPAGLGYYYFVQGLCRIGTQSYITRKFYGDNAEVTATSVDASSTEKASTTGSAPAPRGKASAKAAPTKSSATKSAPERQPGQSARSQAVHKKTATGSTGGRKSGAPRRSGTQKDQRP